MTDTPSTPPGWYDDPNAPGRQRWWDGTTWTDQTQDAPGSAPDAGWGGPSAAPPGVPGAPGGPGAWGGQGVPSGPGFPPPAPSGSSKVPLIVAIVAVVAILGAGLFFLLSDGDDDGDDGGEVSSEADGDETGAPTEPPTGEPEFDPNAQSCFEGDMQACDDLFIETPAGSDYEAYGNTCGGRLPDPRGRFCVDAVPDPEPPG